MTRIVDMKDLRLGRTTRFEGYRYGAAVSFYVVDAREGDGPGPHQHPYEETFVLIDGSALFTVEGEDIEAHAGTILVVPPNTTHGFKAGSDGLRSVNIH